METAKTHDYTVRGWGHNFGINTVKRGGKVLSAYGWGSGIAKGHFLILPNGHGQTRYQVTSIRYAPDPPDMWFAELRFAPRKR